jgi:hypothetical protein
MHWKHQLQSGPPTLQLPWIVLSCACSRLEVCSRIPAVFANGATLDTTLGSAPVSVAPTTSVGRRQTLSP